MHVVGTVHLYKYSPSVRFQPTVCKCDTSRENAEHRPFKRPGQVLRAATLNKHKCLRNKPVLVQCTITGVSHINPSRVHMLYIWPNTVSLKSRYIHCGVERQTAFFHCLPKSCKLHQCPEPHSSGLVYTAVFLSNFSVV
jgi:hypothetical protein